MKIFKNYFPQQSEPSLVTNKSQSIDTKELADAIGKSVARELSQILENLSFAKPGTHHHGDTANDLNIDERVIDVGVSTEGLEKGNQKSLVKETETDYNVSSNIDKLKKLKGK